MTRSVIFSERVDDSKKNHLDRIDAHINGKNVGYLTSHAATEGGVWLKGLKVDPQYRSRGIAKKLLQIALNKYKGQDLRLRAKPYADEPLSMEQLQTFYLEFGFKPYDNEGRMLRPARGK